MAYTKTNWVDGTTEITAARLNNLESQHELALIDARAASGNPLKVEILASLPAAGTKGRVVFNTGDNKFYFDNGTAWNVAAVTNIGQQTITPTTTNQTITEGYHNGTGYAEGDADLVAGNIKDGVTIFGVAGSYAPSQGSHSQSIPVASSSLPFERTCTISMGGDGLLFWAIYMGSYSPDLRYTITIDGSVVHDNVLLSGNTHIHLNGSQAVNTGDRVVSLSMEVDGGGSGEARNAIAAFGSWVVL